MRFVETLQASALRLLLMAAAALVVACASGPDLLAPPRAEPKSQDAPASEKSASEKSASAASAKSAAAVASSASAPASAEPEAPPIDPKAQQAFDNARRSMRAGRMEDAERQLKALAQSHPDLGGVHANLGALYRQAGKLTEAVLELEKAVQLSPKQPVFYNQLGIAYRQQGQFAKARESYEKAMALDAAYASPILNLGILSDLYVQDRKRALALYDQYLALAGADAAVAKWVADLKNRKDDRVALSPKEQP